MLGGAPDVRAQGVRLAAADGCVSSGSATSSSAGRSQPFRGTGTTKHTAASRTRIGWSKTTIVLKVHPWCGQTVDVVRGFGDDAVWIERQDGDLRIVPLSWTALQPRGSELMVGSRPVHLAPQGLGALARWVEARRGQACAPCDERLDCDRSEDQMSGAARLVAGPKADSPDEKHAAAACDERRDRRRGARTGALVGQAGASRARRRGVGTRGGGR